MSAALARAADRSAPGEPIVAVFPVGAIAILALVLSMALVPSAPLAPAPELADSSAETWIELQDWPSPVNDPAIAPTPIEIAADSPAPAVETMSTTISEAPAPTPPEAAAATRPTFDPRALLAAQAPTIPALAPSEGSASATTMKRRRPGGLPTARSLADLPVALAHGNAPAPRSPTASIGSDARVIATTTDARRGDLGGTRDTSDAPAWREQADRRAFLAGVERDAVAERGAGRAATALPRVAAKHGHASAAAVRDAWAADGWHEVPLEALPDCSPPGRQDALKRSIVARARSGSECRSSSGSFRFLQTRNLNAFLMWSRTQPAESSGARGVEDVCDVLERALRCLATPATKELDPR